MDQGYWLRRAARLWPDQAAILSGDRCVASFSEWLRRSAALASMLVGAGSRPGDRIAIVSRNAPEYLEALYGIWLAGMIAVPVNAKLHRSEVQWILDDSGATFAFLDAHHFASSLSTARGAMELGSAGYRTALLSQPAKPFDNMPESCAWIFYTSGTTGRPKGAMLSHRNLAVMSWAYLTEVDPVSPGDVLMHTAPMSHGSGLYALPTLARGGANVVPESGQFDGDEIASLSRSLERISMFAAPTMVRRLVDTRSDIRTQAFRTLVWGGAPMHVPDIVRALDRLGPCLAQIYGQAETPMTISNLSKQDVSDRNKADWLEILQSAGHPSAAVEVRIADGAGADGGTGEILVKGDSVMSGYWNMPDATAETLADGWLRTGDVGTFDGSGRLVLKDRSKEVIISGGTNIYPREIEDVLLRHPKVREVAVVGQPDAEWGEVPVAFLVGDVSEGELDQLCLEHIARFKRPKSYRFVDELPKNNYGKIEKRQLLGTVSGS